VGYTFFLKLCVPLSVSLAALLVFATGCSKGCLTYREIGLLLTVVDSTTGGPVSAPEVMAIAIEGSFRDSVTVRNSQTVGFLAERSGTYRVEVIAEGYRSWVLNGINIEQGECHVRRRQLEVRLQRL
jgi:hypothetical protein